MSLLDPCDTPIWSTWSNGEANKPLGGLQPAWAWKPVWDSWSSLHLLQNCVDAVLGVEFSYPTCPAELGKGSLAFTRVLATNNFQCLFIRRWCGQVPRSTCVKEDWMFSLHSCQACAEAHARGSVGLCPADACGLRTFPWRLLTYRGEDACLHWDVSVRWPRRA